MNGIWDDDKHFETRPSTASYTSQFFLECVLLWNSLGLKIDTPDWNANTSWSSYYSCDKMFHFNHRNLPLFFKRSLYVAVKLNSRRQVWFSWRSCNIVILFTIFHSGKCCLQLRRDWLRHNLILNRPKIIILLSKYGCN